MNNESLIKRMCEACYIDEYVFDGIAVKAAQEILDNHPDFNIEEFERLSVELDQAKADPDDYPQGTEASARISLMIVSENLRVKRKLADEDEIMTIMNKYNFDWQWA